MSEGMRSRPVAGRGGGFVRALAFAGSVLSVAAGLLAGSLGEAGAQGTPAPAAPDSFPAGATPVDTGWVEIGEGFGDDDPFADLPGDSLFAGDAKGGRIRPYLDYNRVDAATVGLDLLFTPEEAWLPGFKIRFARAMGRRDSDQGDGKWIYDLRLDQPLLRDRSLRLGLARYDRTAHDDFPHVGSVENGLASLIDKFDYEDWYDLQGYEVGLTWEVRDPWTFAARYNSDEYGSITEIGYGANGLFRHNEPWRDNPPVDEGTGRSLTFEAEYDSRESPRLPRRGMWHRLQIETSGETLGGDLSYQRYLADLRGYISPSPSHIVKARVMLGTTGHGDVLPFQKTFAVGGIGTLRATPFRQYRGRQLFLLNGDWSWEVFRRTSRNVAIKTGLSLVLFSDFGIAWDAPAWDLGHQRPDWDAGLGVGTTDETLRVYFARDVRAEHAAINVTLRVARSY